MTGPHHNYTFHWQIQRRGVIGEKKRKRELYIIMYVRTYFIDVYIYTRLAFNVNNHANFSKKFTLTPPPPLKNSGSVLAFTYWHIIYTKLNERLDCAVHVVTHEDGNVYLHKSTLESNIFYSLVVLWRINKDWMTLKFWKIFLFILTAIKMYKLYVTCSLPAIFLFFSFLFIIIIFYFFALSQYILFFSIYIRSF